MIPVWLIAAIALLGAVCLALPLHIGMTGVCLLLLAAVLLALRILRKKNAPKVWSRILIALTAISMAVIFGAMGYISVQGKDSAMTPDETPDFIVVLGAQVQGDGPSLTLKKRLDKALEFLQAHPDRTVIVSGGQGPDEAHTEASVMAQYLLAHGVKRNIESFQRFCSHTFSLFNETKKDMLSAEIVMLQAASFFLSQHNNSACSICKTFKQC